MLCALHCATTQSLFFKIFHFPDSTESLLDPLVPTCPFKMPNHLSASLSGIRFTAIVHHCLKSALISLPTFASLWQRSKEIRGHFSDGGHQPHSIPSPPVFLFGARVTAGRWGKLTPALPTQAQLTDMAVVTTKTLPSTRMTRSACFSVVSGSRCE